MNNLHALLLFLVVITSSVSCFSFDNDQEIYMVVDDEPLAIQPGKGMIKAESSAQIGRFKLEDGKNITLLRPLNSRMNCIAPDQPCGALDWCCEGLSCDGIISGRCKVDPSCKAQGAYCNIALPCCYPYQCSAGISGRCS